MTIRLREYFQKPKLVDIINMRVSPRNLRNLGQIRLVSCDFEG